VAELWSCPGSFRIGDGFSGKARFRPVWHLTFQVGHKEVTEPMALHRTDDTFVESLLHRDQGGGRMASPIKHIVEPIVGWLFVFVLIVALCAALLAPPRPTMEATGPSRSKVERAH
jgi:hypothetical protein